MQSKSKRNLNNKAHNCDTVSLFFFSLLSKKTSIMIQFQWIKFYITIDSPKYTDVASYAKSTSLALQYRNITILFLCEPAAEKMYLRTYANIEDPNQSALPHSLVRSFTVRLHNIGTLLKI